MSLLLPLNTQTPETDSDFVFTFPAYLSAEVIGKIIEASLIAADVTAPTESAALIAADIEGAGGGAVVVIDLIESELR